VHRVKPVGFANSVVAGKYRVGCTNSISCRVLVFVEESAEEFASPHLRRASGRCGRRIHSLAVIRRSQFERAVWALLVEMADVHTEDLLELAAAEDQEPVEAFPAHAPDPALRVCVRVRRPDRRADDLDAFASEDRVEGAAELCVAIVDQEAWALAPVRPPTDGVRAASLRGRARE